ncbi:hypothetical protein [Yersinia wautersii]|nr:hypothetical protein [Yersinia wautersii]
MNISVSCTQNRKAANGQVAAVAGIIIVKNKKKNQGLNKPLNMADK